MSLRFDGLISPLFSALLMVAAALCCQPRAEAATWTPIRGTWQLANGAGTGSCTVADPGLLLSAEWYADFDYSGVVTVPASASSDQVTAAVFRYAGPSESYELILDTARTSAYLMENHYGKSCKVASAISPQIVKGSAISFQASGRGAQLTVTVGGAVLGCQAMLIPGGQVGLEVRNGQVSFSGLTASGTACGDYVFHWNYAMPSNLAAEPMWRFIDQCGNDLLSRYPVRSYTTKAQVNDYRKQVVLGIRRCLGLDPWPERNPLNATVVGTIDRGEYKIDKVVFESRPGFLVDALVYIPKNVTYPVPAVLSPSGHYGDQDFYVDSEQGRCIGLARNGYVVLSYDPVGQGERTWLGANHDTLRQTVDLAGMEVSGLMFWDSMRAIDYLCSRPEVDAGRIAVTGVSGGGFNTLYTTLLDPRVKACAINGFTATIESLIKRTSAGCCAYTPGMCLYADYGEMIACLAPRPCLMLGGYSDILADRTVQIYDSAKRIYRLYGADDKIAYYLDPNAGHVYSEPDRIEMIKFFNKHLKGVSDPDVAAKASAGGLLYAQSSGALSVFGSSQSKGKDVITVAREFLARNKIQYTAPANSAAVSAFQVKMKAKLIELMGDMAPATAPTVVSDDGVTSPGSTRHVVLKTERDLTVPINISHPASGVAVKGLVVYFQMADSYSNGSLSKSQMTQNLLNAGYVVAAPQVRGTYSSAPDGELNIQLYTMALGKHLFSTRIYDLQRVIDFLKTRTPYSSLTLTLWGEGVREGPMALYAAAVDSRISIAVSTHGLVAFQDVINRNAVPGFDWYVPGLLRYADCSQLIASAAPRRVIVSAPVYSNGAAVPASELAGWYGWADGVYSVLGQSSKFSRGTSLDVIAELAKY